MWERIGRGKLLLRCCVLGGARRFGAPQREERGGGISWRPPVYSLLHPLEVFEEQINDDDDEMMLTCIFCTNVIRNVPARCVSCSTWKRASVDLRRPTTSTTLSCVSCAVCTRATRSPAGTDE